MFFDVPLRKFMATTLLPFLRWPPIPFCDTNESFVFAWQLSAGGFTSHRKHLLWELGPYLGQVIWEDEFINLTLTDDFEGTLSTDLGTASSA